MMLNQLREIGDVVDESTNKESPSLSRARELLAEGSLEESLAVVKAYWLENPDDAEAAALFSDLMRETGRSELSKRLENLAKQLPTPNLDVSQTPEPQELFEAGFGLIDVRQHELAAMLLNRCAKLVPEEPIVNYELGFSLMSLRRFEQAIPYFEHAASKDVDFDTLFNLATCYMMVRRLDDTQEIIKKLEKLNLDSEQTIELNNKKQTIKRLSRFGDQSQLSSRDWLYILYGSILLRQSTQEQEGKEKIADIATMLAVLKGVLHGLHIDPEVAEYYGAQSRPLTQILAELFEIPASIYKGPDRADKTLLAMTWASDIIGPHESFRKNELKRTMFTYGLSWREPLPLVPEIVGCLTNEEPMPWQQTTSVEQAMENPNILTKDVFGKALSSTCSAILEQARDLESDLTVIQNVQEILDYYSDKERSLVLGNPGAFPYRSEYTAEVI